MSLTTSRIRRTLAALTTLVAGTPGAASLAGEAPRMPAVQLPADRRPPVEYVLDKLADHAIVVLGEGHWIRHDAELVTGLVPRMGEKHVVLAMEVLPADDQGTIDRLLAAPEWDEAASLGVMRRAAWPYREYQAILRAAWAANRHGRTARILALGPPPDWRTRGLGYDAFMAERVTKEVQAGSRVLLYCGQHHAFTRYLQPELDDTGHARAFFDRTGNILRRRFGESVFLVTLHKPIWCGKEPWDFCLPLGGAIDCAADGGGPVGFDVAGTALGERTVEASVYYAHGYRGLHFGEMTDGYVWSRPIERYEDVSLIPLDELAPDDASLAEVLAHNPLSDDKGLDRAALARLWKEEAARRSDPLASRRWQGLVGWRGTCNR
jgi:hypothetical protein